MMPNFSGYDQGGDWDADLHGTGRQGQQPQLPPNHVPNVCGLTSIAEQHARGGWTRTETPVSNSGIDVLPREKYSSGMANAPGRPYDVAAYEPGTI